ncbi:MAG TPA: DUF5916 domain-containing protein [Rhodanobacteraceae bacterium]|nr:DUF5916 domain-containing protein [Rhodanobacteraceae bacterium]
MRMTRFLMLAALAAIGLPAQAITIDGRIDPVEWKGARHVTDFRRTQPLTRKPAEYPVEAWILATTDGLAVAMRVTQPPNIRRTQQQVQRDFHDPVDRVNVEIDFDGDGRTGYDFSVASTGAVDDEVITNENQFDADWDGIWQHAVTQDAEGWSVEVLIPWYTAPMHAAPGGTREIGIYLDRVFATTGERVSWPAVYYQEPRYLSAFERIEVPAYSQSLLAVTPYVSARYDNVGHDGGHSEGVDVFWKPNGQFQLTATLNPDFGQVESDDLVINFGATETYFSDKRPFFTENQGIFAFSLLDDNSQLVYTRRVGAPADDGSGAGDIDAAVKFNGSVGTTSYGVLAADERGDAGRTFGAVRVVHDFGSRSLGMLLTRVDRPFLDRQATVLGLDQHWQPTADLTIATNVVGSDIEQSGQDSRGFGGTFIADYVMGGGWRQQWLGMYFDDRLQVNDFGYLARNDLEYAHWEVRKRITELSTDSPYRDHDWHFRIDALDDTHGLNLRRQLRIERESNLRNGTDEDIELNVNSARWDDLMTRGHGALFLPPSFTLRVERHAPRHGNWAHEWEFDVETGGLSGNGRLGYELEIIPTYFISDALSLAMGVDYVYTPGWLVWQHDNLVGSFDRRSLELESGLDWYIDNRSELRVKLQAIGLDARLRGAYRVAANGRALPSDDAIDSFGVRTLGLQVRYRHELAPLSYLYVVYGRGGYEQAPILDDVPGAPQLLRDSFSLRDTEQWLVKLNYRFDM